MRRLSFAHRRWSIRFAILSPAILTACLSSPDQRTTPPRQNDAPASPPSKELSASQPKELSDDTPLREGHIVFRGMVRPTKGGYQVRDVILDDGVDGVLQKALVGAPGGDSQNTSWFLGAVVRIEGELREHKASAEQKRDVMMQVRGGSWFYVTRLDSAAIVKPAEAIEGTLSNSKGFFALAGRLISREDIAWSLAPNGGLQGDRVRLYGQSRTVVCEPNAQCLIEGSLPLFDVGRAERLP
jgi:hypothetical protein